MRANILSFYDTEYTTERWQYSPIYRCTQSSLVKAVNNIISSEILPKKKYYKIEVKIYDNEKIIDQWTYKPTYINKDRYESEKDVMYIIDDRFIVLNGVTVKECKTEKSLENNIKKYCIKYNLK